MTMLAIIVLITLLPMCSCTRSYPNKHSLNSRNVSSNLTKGFTLPIYHKDHPEVRNYFEKLKPLVNVNPPIGRRTNTLLYYVKFSVGKMADLAPVERFAAFDTGSYFTWLQFTDSYDPTSSSTYRVIPCDSAQCKEAPSNKCEFGDCVYSMQYADFSTFSGYVGMDTFFFNSENSTAFADVVFGDNDGASISYDGVMGVSRHPLGLLTALKVETFSVCFPKGDELESSASFGEDAFFLGETTELLLLEHSNHFGFYAKHIIVNGEDTYGGNFIFDTGASLTYLNTVAMDGVLKLVTRHIPASPVSSYDGFELCYGGDALRNSLELTFELPRGKFLRLYSSNLWIGFGSDICLAIRRTTKLVNIFGAKQMQGWKYGFNFTSREFTFINYGC